MVAGGTDPRKNTPPPAPAASRSIMFGAGAIAAILAAGLVNGLGATRLTTLGIGLLTFGIALWIGSLWASEVRAGTDERSRRQRSRSVAIALGLGGLVALFYVATIVRLGPNALRKDGFSQMGAKKNFDPKDLEVCKKPGAC